MAPKAQDTGTVKKTVKHAMFSWYELGDHPYLPDTQITTEHHAFRGQEIEIPVKAAAFGDYHGAFFTDEELAGQNADVSDEEQADVDTPTPTGSAEVDAMSVDDLAAVIKDNNLNAQQTVILAYGDPERAKKVLDAENIATGGAPRDTVVAGLNAVVNRT